MAWRPEANATGTIPSLLDAVGGQDLARLLREHPRLLRLGGARLPEQLERAVELVEARRPQVLGEGRGDLLVERSAFVILALGELLERVAEPLERERLATEFLVDG